ncbi:carboxymuconolactone decarboxylase family protein [Amycolatopsis acidiphila]|uniref:Carboxymuconolactone decarboxylase family protein n=1 Tax=Amycolatopsis acidiphila TaxID=715473 RepID=A0A557ZXY1_9PSEU|nr:carboxymuconolactone decarboxylase family protein [Amycolatopsis acidiphila]TVT16866.1 carboxymuconolactone decarboxylase family protein [Amycolatopsis acidiphila]UIJ58713.1 carboxymuconolactone decarboxylase family protein [Amycolatopsis acidiphila]GHG75882.1 alkyl hydroperoxide reductase AhpD [Amycolatopsis acidiphila]
MSTRYPLSRKQPELLKQLIELNNSVNKLAADAGLDPLILELCKIRASQLNGCAFCLDMHVKYAREHGETEQRIYLLDAWRETDRYTEQERAALALTDAMTKLSQTQDVPDEVYEQATAVLTEEQYAAVAWAVTTMNAFNRLNVTSRTPVPR